MPHYRYHGRMAHLGHDGRGASLPWEVMRYKGDLLNSAMSKPVTEMSTTVLHIRMQQFKIMVTQKIRNVCRPKEFDKRPRDTSIFSLSLTKLNNAALARRLFLFKFLCGKTTCQGLVQECRGKPNASGDIATLLSSHMLVLSRFLT
ncbi:hypothetical protein O181_035969 [Austropuccinia psidii MF-1]|uniref:Uncharacterized protein n=1 Tax=Austropuccinia psidii MF-1 TaxID=1389203 RepID=A0A9Q3HB30_9BASI|nr:hypothetical protein [Austropuccinia psidii MF-1]